MLSYLIQTTICLAAFYALYAVLLSRETFFHTNRVYLLGTLALSIILPIVPDITLSAPAGAMQSFTLEPVVISISDAGQAVAEAGRSLSWMTLLGIAYALGVLIVGVRFVRNLLAIFKLRRHGITHQVYGRNVIMSHDVTVPFSFFQWIFLPDDHLLDDTECAEIVRHESAHASAWHSIDILSVELVSVFLWPSPMIYFYKTAIRRVHEYLADAEVLRDTPLKQYGHLLLSRTAPGMQMALANHFFHNQLKHRIIMMTKNKSRRSALLKYGMLLPAVLLTTLLFAFRQQANPTGDIQALITRDSVPGQVFKVVEEMPRFPGCEDTGLEGDARFTCAQQKMLEHIYQRITYPKAARSAGVSGRVVVQFIVRSDGSIANAEIVRSIGYGTDEDVLKVINSMPQWRPGYQAGKAVDVQMTLPISYKLDNQDAPKANAPVVVTALPVQDKQTFKVVDEMPRFAGCEDEDLEGVALMECAHHKLIEYISSQLQYPEAAMRAHIEGKSVVQFIVHADGSVGDAKIIRSIGYGTDEAVLALFPAMPSWTPGRQDGKAVDVEMTLPITFALPKTGQKDEGLRNSSTMEVTVYPVPSRSSITYEVQLERASEEVVIELLDQKGSSIHQEVRTVEGGTTQFKGTLEPGKLTPGTYVLRVICNNEVVAKNVVIQ